MPHANRHRPRRLDPRLPLVFDTRTLGPAAMRSVTSTVPAPANLGVELVSVPEEAELELDVRLERVTEGVLVTGTVRAPLVGECARCLDLFASATEVRFTELFTHEPGDDDADGYLLDGDLLDLEPALRDALVLELPLAPLCAEDCPGLCSECGVRLADAGAGHGHADAGSDRTPDGTPVPETRKER
ncbi:MAG TPA: YceD family protein [Streptosporangiaceae bacterium]|nr:YceD family protein [Streptosporangiaceae bacterium]